MNIDSINSASADSSFSGKTTQPVNDTDRISSADTVVSTSSDTTSTSSDAEADMLVAKSEESNQEDVSSLKDMKDINKIINQNTIAEFGYNEPTKRITIKIKDKETDEVIKEIPSEKALKMLAKAWELAGIMVDEKR